MVIKKNIELLWPHADTPDFKGTMADTINWKPYPGAEKYYVEIMHVRHEGTTTHYTLVTSQVITGKMFERAQKINPEVCIPDRYRANCE